MKKIILLLFLHTISSFSQTSEKDALIWFDNIIEQKNLDVNVGIRYIEEYKTLNDNNHFLIDDKFYASTIHYQGQTYHNIPLKYDVYSDQVIFKISSNYDNYSMILDKDKISSFITQNKLFIKIKEKDYGFNEKLFSKNEITLYKKHYKRLTKTINRNIYFDKFIIDNSYLLFLDNKYFPVNNKKEWKRIFPLKKSEINKFFSKNRKKIKISPDIFMEELLIKITTNS